MNRELDELEKKLKRDARKLSKLEKRHARFMKQYSFSPVVAEAVALLSDNELVWSDDFIRIRLALAQLIQVASKQPATSRLAEELSEQLIYGGDLIDDIAFH